MMKHELDYPGQIRRYYRHTRFDYQTFWDRRAVHFGFYDDQARKHAAALENMNRVMAGWANIQAGERVLDAGCGRGSACFWLARHRQARVMGINLVGSQVEDCRRYAGKNGFSGVEFLEADYRDTPFADETFDVVWACESICHSERKLDFYLEAWRVLKPGGRLVIAEYIRSERPAAREAEGLLAAWLHPWAIPDIDTAGEHREQARTAGFLQLDWRDVTPNVRVSLFNLYTISRQWLPLGRFLNRLKLVSAVRLNNARASVAQYEALEAGAWWYGLGLAVK